jgi:hypothetical protein
MKKIVDTVKGEAVERFVTALRNFAAGVGAAGQVQIETILLDLLDDFTSKVGLVVGLVVEVPDPVSEECPF